MRVVNSIALLLTGHSVSRSRTRGGPGSASQEFDEVAPKAALQRRKARPDCEWRCWRVLERLGCAGISIDHRPLDPARVAGATGFVP